MYIRSADAKAETVILWRNEPCWIRLREEEEGAHLVCAEWMGVKAAIKLSLPDSGSSAGSGCLEKSMIMNITGSRPQLDGT